MKKIIDVICLSLAAVVVGGIAVWNIAQTDRPTISEMENRKLAEMPEFTVESLFDGSYFRGISAFVSDTFPERDRLVALSKKMDTLKGLDYKLGGEDSFVVLDPTGNADETTDTSLLDQAFENLKNPETEAPLETGSSFTPIVGEIETDPVETVSPETTPSETNLAESTSPETEPAETEPVYFVKSLTLSKTAVNLTVGSGAVIHAYLDTDNPSPGNVKWSLSDASVAAISVNPNGGIDVKGLSEGTCILRCKYDDQWQALCEITVTAVVPVTPPKQEYTADFLTNGTFIYGDAVYTPVYYSASNASYYARTAAYYKTLFGSKVRMNVVVAPLSSMVVDNEKVKESIADQGVLFGNMAALMDPSVNFVDTYSLMYEHRNEYLFFKSDHHWTQLGAYYAYAAYAKSVGLTPTPLSEFERRIQNTDYHGTMYMYTQDERVKNFADTVEAYLPTKAHTMTVTGTDGRTYHYNSSIVEGNKTYVAFIAGDNPYTVINVPENPQDFNVLVLKDSFGNAMVPFLCEHYGNIIVVDVRHSSMNVWEHLKDYQLSDIIFINNFQAALTPAWSDMYLAAVGVGSN